MTSHDNMILQTPYQNSDPDPDPDPYLCSYDIDPYNDNGPGIGQLGDPNGDTKNIAQNKIVRIVINPRSGSYKESFVQSLTETITHVLNKSDKSDNKFKIVVLKTESSNHAKRYFQSLNESEINSTPLIIMIGGDGIVHEVVNGLWNNEYIRISARPLMDLQPEDFSDMPKHQAYQSNLPLFAICPTGSGNHLAKLIKTDTHEKFIKALTNFSEGMYVCNQIIPTEIIPIPRLNDTNSSIDNETLDQTLDQALDRTLDRIISINTIVSGIPGAINGTATYLAPYIPRYASFLKYEIATLWNLFGRNYLSIDTESGETVDNIIGLFVQTTPTCGNKFIVDPQIDGTELSLTYGYIQDMYSCHMALELMKEKSGIRSGYFVRRYNKDQQMIINPADPKVPGFVTVDGQIDSIELPVTVRKADLILNFITHS